MEAPEYDPKDDIELINNVNVYTRIQIIDKAHSMFFNFLKEIDDIFEEYKEVLIMNLKDYMTRKKEDEKRARKRKQKSKQHKRRTVKRTINSKS